MTHQTTARSALSAVLLAVGFGLSAPAIAHDDSAQGGAFEDRVRAYLMANPEVILQALEGLQAREAAKEQQRQIAQFPQLFSAPPVLGLGDFNAPVRVVEFFDYKCAPCKAVHAPLETLVKAHPELRVEMWQLPILSPGSERASRFALAVLNIAGAEAYQTAHARLWDHKGPFNTGLFAEISDQLGLDFVNVEAAMWSDAVTGQIAENRDIALALGIIGTPAFVTPIAIAVGETDPDRLKALLLSR